MGTHASGRLLAGCGKRNRGGAGKRISGRKRHIVTDMTELPVALGDVFIPGSDSEWPQKTQDRASRRIPCLFAKYWHHSKKTESGTWRQSRVKANLAKRAA